MLRRIASVLALGLSLALVTTHAQELDKPLVFTRATLIATAVESRLFFHELRRLGGPLQVTIQTPELPDLR